MWLKLVLAILRVVAPSIAKGYHKSRDDRAERSRIEEAQRLIEKAREAIDTAQYRNFTTLELFDTEGEHYLGALKEIWQSKPFALFIDIHKNTVVSQIMNGDAGAAVEGQGILKGIDYIMKNIYAAKQKYDLLKESQQV